MGDNAGINRPNRRDMLMYCSNAVTSWDGMFYAVVCGRTLLYDVVSKTWKNMEPTGQPTPPSRGWRYGYSWGGMCADPVNRELVFFGGCGAETPRADVGTRVYSVAKNEWRELELETQPPQRALSPMVYDPGTKKIVLFGGDRLNRIWSDTWVYDCPTRTWQERKPALSPAPRFGHALLYLPKSRKIALLGGNTYRLTYGSYESLPFEVWTYDVAGGEWKLVQHLEKGGPPSVSTVAATAAANDEDIVLWVASAGLRKSPHSSWLCRLDATKVDAAGTAKHGVKPGTITMRTGPYDPENYTEDVPAPNPAAQEAFYKNLPANQFVSVKAPRWPTSRRGGGWSTVSLDTDRDQILHIGGGHSSYFGSDVTHFDIKQGRWSINIRPEFALNYNQQLSGAGPFAFSNSPWGNHNYHAYAYDPTIKRMVYMKHFTHFYDPEKRKWIFEERLKTPFRISKYTTYVRATPKGVIAWTHVAHQTTGMFRLEGGKQWVKLPLTGKLPVTVCDGSAGVYDSKRDRFLMVTSKRGKDRNAVLGQGQVWSYDFKTGECKSLDPANREALKAGRFAREAVYLPKCDMMLVGYLLNVGGKKVLPFYDCEKNEWLVAEIPGAEGFIGRRGGIGSSVDLGLIYETKRDLVWGTLCRLRDENHMKVLRADRASLKLEVLK
jgi:hypothetical protein